MARLTSYVKALPLSDQMAHRRLAALSDQWRRVGWADEQVAVAVFVVDSAVDGKPFPGCVFATSAGVSIIPGGVRLPVGVLPLTRIPGINPDAVAALAGCTDPKAKIEQLTPSKWGRPAALVVIDDVDTQAIITAGDASPAQLAVTSLIRPGLESDQLQGAINAGTFRYGRPGVSESAADLRSLGWSSDGEKPREYDRALREYLFATALASWGTDRRAAAYALGELEGSPEIERD
ncbi:hypothetical protein [Mycolicibacter acidiphilus]|uniref:hypothetical protein n=1 Tax=Mycolicibacter acidiphilus TaxID=2835306 RepID=UPI001BD4FD00|nr:hypothetical protein [Mycolicibacter acidiphilus]